MEFIKKVSLLAFILLFSSCYHAKIITGEEPSGEVINKPWASGWIFGLVPPAEIRSQNECENGVAQVDTQISFLNGLVSAITFNIYTPMHITVTCAAGSGMSMLEPNPPTDIIIPENSKKPELKVSEGS